jgi:hypothetical protein
MRSTEQKPLAIRSAVAIAKLRRSSAAAAARALFFPNPSGHVRVAFLNSDWYVSAGRRRQDSLEFQSFIPVWISCPALHERKPAITWYFLNKKQWLAELVLLWWHDERHQY